MKEKCRVISIDSDFVRVLPLISDACINCNTASCAKSGTPFEVRNSENLPISVGSVVKIGASVKIQTIQAILALIIPFAAAIIGYAVTAFNEPVRVSIALGSFVCAAAGVVIFTKVRKNKTSFAHIVSVES